MDRLTDYIASDEFGEKVLTLAVTGAIVTGLYVIGHIVYAVARGAF